MVKIQAARACRQWDATITSGFPVLDSIRVPIASFYGVWLREARNKTATTVALWLVVIITAGGC